MGKSCSTELKSFVPVSYCNHRNAGNKVKREIFVVVLSAIQYKGIGYGQAVYKNPFRSIAKTFCCSK